MVSCKYNSFRDITLTMVQISAVYAFFMNCECILIETLVGSSAVPEDIWQFAAERIMIQPHLILGKTGQLKYFIVGNQIDGYSGIGRDRGDVSENGTWIYRMLDPINCRRIVASRTRAIRR